LSHRQSSEPYSSRSSKLSYTRPSGTLGGDRGNERPESPAAHSPGACQYHDLSPRPLSGLPTLPQRLQKLVDCQIASIYAINEATNVVTTLLFASTLPIQRKAGDTWPFSGNSVELHLKLGHPHIQDLELDNTFPGSRKYLEAGIKSGLWAPLTHQGRTTDFLSFAAQDPMLLTITIWLASASWQILSPTRWKRR